MSLISEAAAAALEAERLRQEQFQAELRATLVGICKQALATLSGGLLDVDALSVEHTDVTQFLTVFSDGQVPLAVYEDGRVQLVTGSGSTWTRKGQPLRSFAELGAALQAGAT